MLRIGLMGGLRCHIPFHYAARLPRTLSAYSKKLDLSPLSRSNSTPDILRDVLTAQCYDLCKETSLTHAKGLSNDWGNEIYIKREDQQATFSFNIRGAANRISSLSTAESSRGVVAVGAGGHAMGVAHVARENGIKATIVTPLTTSPARLRMMEALGGENLEVSGDSGLDLHGQGWGLRTL